MERYSSIDLLKFFAILAVVCIHTNLFLGVSVFGFTGTYMLVNTLARFAVPFFFTAAGFLFGKKMRSVSNRRAYFTKYVWKLAKLYIVWTAFYFFYHIIEKLLKSAVEHVPFRWDLLPSGSISSVFKLAVRIFYSGYVDSHMWFLIALIWSVSIVYFFAVRKKLSALLIGSLLLHLAGLFGDSYSGIVSLPFASKNALFYGLFYCTLGCFFAFHESEILGRFGRFSNATLGAGVLVCFSLQFVERTVLSQCFKAAKDYNFYISTIPLTALLFLLAVKNRDAGQNRRVTRVGAQSSGIYVIHLFFVQTVSFLLLRVAFLQAGTLLYTVWFTPLVFALSFLSYRALHRAKAPMRQAVRFLQAARFPARLQKSGD